MNMIEEIKTPVSTPMSGTPLPSPMVERSSVVRTGRHLKISAIPLLIRFQPDLHNRARPPLSVEITGPPVSLPGPTFPHCDFTLPAAQIPRPGLSPDTRCCPPLLPPPSASSSPCRHDLDSLARNAAGRVILAGSQRPGPQQAAEC